MLRKASYALAVAIVIVTCVRLNAASRPKLTERSASVSIHGTDYTIVDRVDYGAYPSEFAKPVNAFKTYEPGEVCVDSSEAPSGEPSLEWLLRIPNAKSSGFAIAPVKIRVFKHQVLGPQFERGEIEIAVYNPCRDPIAVPVWQNLGTGPISIRENGAPTMNPMMFTFLISNDRGETVLDTGLVLAASSGRPESYRVLRQNEAVVLEEHFQVSPFTMSREDFLRIARNLNISANYWSVSIDEDGKQTQVIVTGENGHPVGENYFVPHENPPVPLEVDN